MKEIQDQKQLHSFLQTYQLETIFNEALMPYLSLYRFDQGELICSQGEPSQVLYVLVKGKIKVYTTSEEGKILIISFKTPTEVIGDIEYIQHIPIINTVEAVSQVNMIGVPYRMLEKYAADYPPLLNFLLHVITRKFYVKSNFLSFNMMHPVEVRLASYLLSVSYDDSDSEIPGQLNSFRLTDVANFIGTSYRHLNRIIQKLCTEGLIERSKGLILVKDKEGLSALANHNIYE
ncbi:cAMP-binding domain of CRP or a regulatory subunit of cAMP-dependent protein kinases [Paenibacillus sophorae]|uniref:Crp/Fnr family transcriptional regulator n=1 Tax=Paenibacillus sophorae TaxID=1333845 RepID=A0A1H8FGT0_9BACL|nr:Crp/Fnr family transcriptional regulator [Paenibacillus sophorae]QWU13865.1 Crp/Fnr family transcriptional regulator [Paenibacillus sophorae]SEN30820.1 cAMP-binding domain of CRP or a regulatory subunit of cAMP-dependent protein kinases [Paenibacillus sophorae]